MKKEPKQEVPKARFLLIFGGLLLVSVGCYVMNKPERNDVSEAISTPERPPTTQGTENGVDTTRAMNRKPDVSHKQSKDEKDVGSKPHDEESLNQSSCTARNATLVSDDMRKTLPHKFVPPLLWSNPGSGNTWIRTLIESSTGFLTGSVYYDEQLEKTLHGESHCDTQVIAIKLHPLHFKYSYIMSPKFAGAVDVNKKCLPLPAFDSAVIVMRHPLDSLWSDFQREALGDHHSVMTPAIWKTKQRHFEKFYPFFLKKYTEAHGMFRAFTETHPKGSALFLKYEDFTDRYKQLGALEQIVSFLGFNATKSTLQCSFQLSDKGSIHRHHADGEKIITKPDVFTEKMTCKLWKIVKTAAEFYGYDPYGFKC